MIQSGDVLSELPVTGSLLVTLVIAQATLASQLSVAFTASVTETKLPLGGQSTSVLATTPMITGASASTTTTRNELLLALPRSSVAVQVTVLVPCAKTDPDGGVQLNEATEPQLSTAVAV